MSDRAALDRFEREIDVLLSSAPVVDEERELVIERVNSLSIPGVWWVPLFGENWMPTTRPEVQAREARILSALGGLGFENGREDAETRTIVYADENVKVATTFSYEGARTEHRSRLFVMKKVIQVRRGQEGVLGGKNELHIFNARTPVKILTQEYGMRQETVGKFEKYAKWAMR